MSFTSQVIVDDGRLLCPACKEIYLHHEGVEIFNRREDAGDGVHVVVNNHDAVASLSVDHVMEKNPSSRRSGMFVLFSCEFCHGEGEPPTPLFKLCISQHKGLTLMEWMPK